MIPLLTPAARHGIKIELLWLISPYLYKISSS